MNDLTSDEELVMMAAQLADKGVLWMLVDSGAYGHVCPKEFALDCGVQVQQGIGPDNVSGADGRALQYFGAREVWLELEDQDGQFWLTKETSNGPRAHVRFDVLNVQKPILAVNSLREVGITTHFAEDGAYLKKGAVRLPLYQLGRLYYLPVKLMSNRVVSPVIRSSQFLGTELKEEADLMAPMTQEDSRIRLYVYEYCCYNDSRLSEAIRRRNAQAIRLGLPLFDLSRPSIVMKLIESIQSRLQVGAKVFVWMSLPCSPWSSWHKINLLSLIHI